MAQCSERLKVEVTGLKQRKKIINVKEVKGSLFGLRALGNKILNTHIRIKTEK